MANSNDPEVTSPGAEEPDVVPDVPPKRPEPMPGLVEGRMVHYTLPDGPRRGEHRAAVIVRVVDPIAGKANLSVFLNGAEDFPAHEHPGNNWFVAAVEFSETPSTEGCWHWIERA